MGIIWGIIIIILVFAFGIVGVVVNLLKEIFMPRSRQQNQNNPRKPSSQSRKKMIDKNEGEYVDFEEV